MKYIFLSQEFYDDYTHCTEIEQKLTRPYTKVSIVVNGINFAIPLRSNINHPNVVWTDKAKKCGLDLSKTVVVTSPHYIDTNSKPHIRIDEFESLRGKEYIIRVKLISYIKIYKKAKENLDIKRNKDICNFSTLQYFESYIINI